MIELALAAAVGCLSAYGVLYLHRRGAVCRRRHPNAARVRRWCLVEPDEPADHAGIAPGDVIVRVGERPVSHDTDVRSVVVGADPGTHVPIDFARKDARATVDVTLLPVPAQQAAR